MATVASDAGRVYAAMRHGEVCYYIIKFVLLLFFWGSRLKELKICSDSFMVFQVLVFDGCTFLLETVLEGRKEPVWQVCNQISLLFQLVLKLDGTILYGMSATRYFSIDNQF